MDNLKKHITLPELIVKSFYNALSEPETQQLKQWLDIPENREFYEKLRTKNREEKKTLIKQLHRKEQWQKLEQVIAPRQNRRYIRILRYAAVLLLPLTIAILVFREILPRQEPTVMNAQQLHIAPGTPKARLILESGEQIEINANQEFSIDKKDGTIINNANNTLQVAQTDKALCTNTFKTLDIPKGGEYKIILQDGTIVWLNSDTRLRFPTAFNEEKRIVYLEGEAYFDVAHHPEKPFIVTINDLQIQVLGTKFNVKAYPEDNIIHTTLSEGSIKASDKQVGNPQILKANEQSIYHKTNHTFQKRTVDATIYMSWTQGRFVFENEPLEEIMKQLSRWYNIDIIYQNQEVKDYCFTGDIDRFDYISTILDMIEVTYKVSFTQIDNRIIVNKK